MALGAVDYLHSHGRKPGKEVLICALAVVRLRACRKREVAAIGALDDTQLAELRRRSLADCEGTVEALYRSGGHRRADGGGKRA